MLFERVLYLSYHAKYEVCCSYGAKVMVKVSLFPTDTHRQIGQKLE